MAPSSSAFTRSAADVPLTGTSSMRPSTDPLLALLRWCPTDEGDASQAAAELLTAALESGIPRENFGNGVNGAVEAVMMPRSTRCGPLHLASVKIDSNIELGSLPIELAALRGTRNEVEILFPFTSPIPTVTNWSVDGIISHIKSESKQREDDDFVDTRKSELRRQGDDAFERQDYLNAPACCTQHTKLGRASEQICLLKGNVQEPRNENLKHKAKFHDDSMVFKGPVLDVYSQRTSCSMLLQVACQTEKGKEDKRGFQQILGNNVKALQDLSTKPKYKWKMMASGACLRKDTHHSATVPVLLLLLLVLFPCCGAATTKECPMGLLAKGIATNCIDGHRTMTCCDALVQSFDTGGGPPCLCQISVEASRLNVPMSYKHLFDLYINCGGHHGKPIQHNYKCDEPAGLKLPPPTGQTYKPLTPKTPPIASNSQPTYSELFATDFTSLSKQRFNLKETIIDVLLALFFPVLAGLVYSVTKLFLLWLIRHVRAYLNRLTTWLEISMENSENSIELVEIITEFEAQIAADSWSRWSSPHVDGGVCDMQFGSIDFRVHDKNISSHSTEDSLALLEVYKKVFESEHESGY